MSLRIKSSHLDVKSLWASAVLWCDQVAGYCCFTMRFCCIAEGVSSSVLWDRGRVNDGDTDCPAVWLQREVDFEIGGPGRSHKYD